MTDEIAEAIMMEVGKKAAAAKIAPALISGNTVVLKPTTQGSISALLMTKAFDKAGLPNGVLNVVQARDQKSALIWLHLFIIFM